MTAPHHTPPGVGHWTVPESLSDLAGAVDEDVLRVTSNRAAAEMVRDCLTNSWRTSMRWASTAVRGKAVCAPRPVFVATGDIPAMWLRDSAAQVRPYLAVANDPVVGDVIAGVIAQQVSCLLLDPYANAFNDGPTGAHGDTDDRPVPAAHAWERKYEADSPAAVLQLGYALWHATGRYDHLDDRFHTACREIVALWQLERDHDQSSYTFERPVGPNRHDSLTRQGRGTPVAVTGMTWCGFRPSDDRCELHYLVPANAFAAVTLIGLAELADGPLADPNLAAVARLLSQQIVAAIERHAVFDKAGAQVYAYEVDGLGAALFADDANLPNLLGLPYFGFCRPDDSLYQSTRKFVLSAGNPWYTSGRAASGLGSPHTPAGHVWPIALATAGLTGTPEDAVEALVTLAGTTAGTGLAHESFHADDPAKYTRAWFGWANAMVAELGLHVTGRSVAHHYPVLPGLVT